MIGDNKDTIQVKSKEAKRLLNVSDCELMHLRTSGKIKATKQGSSFVYEVEKSKA